MQNIPGKVGWAGDSATAARVDLLGRRRRGCWAFSPAWRAALAAAGTNTGAEARSVELTPAQVAEVENQETIAATGWLLEHIPPCTKALVCNRSQKERHKCIVKKNCSVPL